MVIAIIAILIALLVRSTEGSRCGCTIACTNSMKQTILAVHNVYGVYKAYRLWAPMVGHRPPRRRAYNGTNWMIFNHLLPTSIGARFTICKPRARPRRLLRRAIHGADSVFLCPADLSTVGGLSKQLWRRHGFAVSIIHRIILCSAIPRRNDGQCVQGNNNVARITDSLSNVVFRQVYSSCSLSNGSASASTSAAALWADSTLPWRPIMCHNTASKA